MIDWNVVLPYLIGGLVTLAGGWIGAYLSYRKDSKTIVEEADDRAFLRIEASAKRLEIEIDKLRSSLKDETDQRIKEAQVWDGERRKLVDEVTRLTSELEASREEAREFSEVIAVLRQRSDRQDKEIESLRHEAAQSRSRIQELETENHRLRNGSPKEPL